MSARRSKYALIALLLTTASIRPAAAVTFDEALEYALSHNAAFRVALAGRDMADARLTQARAAQFPTLSATGEIATARTDLGGFFGFGEQTVTPRAAGLSLQQPLLSLSAMAGIDKAKAGQTAAQNSTVAARLNLAVDVAEAYTGMLAAQEVEALYKAQLDQMTLLEREAALLFNKGGVSRTDVAQAGSRLAAARVDVARAAGDVAQARARFISVVGLEPEDLSAVQTLPSLPATLPEASSVATLNNQSLNIAKARAAEADAAVRMAKAERLPSLALAAEATTVRDQFFPGYRTNELRLGVRGRWNIFSSGLISGKIDEAEAARRAAGAQLDGTKSALEEAVAVQWQAVLTADTLRDASGARARAADLALSDVRAENKQGVKPLIQVLDAQREALVAHLEKTRADGAYVVNVYRLHAVLGVE